MLWHAFVGLALTGLPLWFNIDRLSWVLKWVLEDGNGRGGVRCLVVEELVFVIMNETGDSL
jgi:hypothetical protein